jgi:hypothetical protein
MRPPGGKINDPDLRDNDPLDISIAELADETADRLTARRRFLTLGDIDVVHRKKPMGFACSAIQRPRQSPVGRILR